MLRRGRRLLLGITLFFALCGLQATVAQDGPTVTGTVTDASTGGTLPGVNIQVVGTQIGTTTDAQGTFELTVPSENATLQFSFVGFQTQTVDLNGRTSVDVALEPATLTGEEVVVTGYSEQRRADLTGSVEVVDTEELERLPGGQISDKLQGNAAGVSVISSGQPGQDPQIRIRGVNTFGNNTPLFVVDGVPTQEINNLNPSDIASLQVLKSASAASIYGARASNGVVIIETKKGEGDISVEFNSYAGVSRQPNVDNPYNMLSPKGRAELEWLAFRNSGREPSDPQYGSGEEPKLPNYILPAGASEVDESSYFVIPQYNSQTSPTEFTQIVRANKQGTDWMDQIFNPAGMTKQDVTVSGGWDQGSYLFSGGYLNQQGTLMRTFLERFSVRANTTFEISDNITVGENLSYTVEDNKLANELTEGSAIGMAHRARPIVPVRDIRGNFAGSKGAGLGNPSNPVAMRERTRNNVQLNKRLFGNTFVEVNFLSDFSFRSSLGVDIESGYNEDFQFPTYENSENNTRNAVSESAFNNHQWTFSNTLNYNGTLGESHNLSVLAGAEWQKQNTRFENATVTDFFSFDPNFVNLGNGSGTPIVGSATRITTLVSQFGKVDYNYQRRYFVSGTLRRDASSKFLQNRYGLFPAFSLAWRPVAEPYLDGVLPGWLSDLKIRGGWGVIGNQLNVDPNNAYSLFASNQFGYNTGGSNTSLNTAFYRSRIGAADAKWERNVSVNAGIDIAFFDGQIDATVDWYRKDIEDLLFQAGLLATAGQATPPFRNVASMRNSGIDASLNGRTQIGDLQISGGVNITSYNNEITGVSGNSDNFAVDARRNGTIIRNEVGHPISSYYGYNIVGFWQSDQEISTANSNTPEGVETYQTGAAPGRFRYEDVNGDGQITPKDRTFLGSPNPNFTAGLNLTLRYKQFDFSTSLYGSQGAEIYNQVKWWTDFYSGFNGAKSKVALNDSWTPNNRDAEAPIQELERSFSTNQVPNSYFVEDGDYLRVRNVQLGYTVPSSLSQQIGAENLRVYVQATNLFTFTTYSNPEPEIGGGDETDVTGFGIDEGAYPTPREFIAGVNLTF
ncbi:MAG: SusC/RagA family TonB-linked outer membrane protein [Salinibacter sp.]